MTSATKIQIINDCFTELRISGITSQPDNEDIVLALGRLENMMHELQINIGYRFEENPDPNSYTGIPAHANFAIASALALRICTAYGKPPEALMRQAGQSMSTLINRVAAPQRVNYPSRQPMGMGNRQQHHYYKFMPEVVNAPTDVSTEQINVGDVLPYSIDFSQYLQPLEVVASYTKLLSDGITGSGYATSGASISFSITGGVSGFQQILFSVTGDAGTKVNRTLNFNVVESTAARGNP